MTNNPPRLLHQRSEHGYTHSTRQALHNEPETIQVDARTWHTLRSLLDFAHHELETAYQAEAKHEIAQLRHTIDQLNRRLSP